jgi:hypothetical protein
MSGVFLSYSRTDRELAEQVVRALRAIGVDVWWDQDMPGVDWQQELERQVTELSALVVIWTPASINSDYVRDEARLALSRHKLVNVLQGVAAPPFPFDRINGLPIDDWNGRDSHGGWQRLVATVEEYLVKASVSKPGELTGALSRRDRALQDAQASIAAAEAAFQEAKLREGETREAAATAKTAFDAVELQFQRVAEMRVSAAVLHAAQSDLDAGRATMENADAERRAAAASVSAAARALTRARSDLDHLFDRPAMLQNDTAPSPPPSPLPAPPTVPPPPVLPAPLPPPPPPIPKPALIAIAVVGAVLSLVVIIGLLSGRPAPRPSDLTNAADNAALAANTTDTNGTNGTNGTNATADTNDAVFNNTFRLNTNTTPAADPSIATWIVNAKAADGKSDYDAAVGWWRLAAGAGDADGQAGLGVEYALGQGVTEDDHTAFAWFQKSADQGNATGEFWVGNYYANGYGMTVDMPQARVWMQKAADQGESRAKDWLSEHP